MKNILIWALSLSTCLCLFAQDQDGILHVPAESDYTVSRGAGPSFAEQVIIIVNQERWDNGQLPPLKYNAQLETAALAHSTAMAERDFFAHCDLDTGTSAGTRVTNAGYSWNSVGENIAAGYSNATSVMTGWMNSSGHRANILRTTYRELGVGYYYQAGDQGNIRDGNSSCGIDELNIGPFFHYWTQNFGRSSNVYPVVINREAYETDVVEVSLYIYGEGFATEMRVRNSDGNWTGWQPYESSINWTLSQGMGTKQVDVEIRNGGGTVRSASDTIISTAEPTCFTTQDYDQAIDQWDGLTVTILDLLGILDFMCDEI